jgi:uncharacterized protein (DUF1810 family)
MTLAEPLNMEFIYKKIGGLKHSMKTNTDRTFRKLTEAQADIEYPNWRTCANIHKSGSITGMRNKFNWRGLVIQVGSYYYHIGG